MVSAAASAAAASTSWPARASRSSGRPGRSPCTDSMSNRRTTRSCYRIEVEMLVGHVRPTLAADLGTSSAAARTCGPPAHGHRLVHRGRRRAPDTGELLPRAKRLRDYERVTVDDETATLIRHGRRLPPFDGPPPWASLAADGTCSRLRGRTPRAAPLVVLGGACQRKRAPRPRADPVACRRAGHHRPQPAAVARRAVGDHDRRLRRGARRSRPRSSRRCGSWRPTLGRRERGGHLRPPPGQRRAP
jgi:hypothetical protein